MATQPSFLTGWHNLPDELKILVLRYALPSGERFSRHDIWHGTPKEDSRSKKGKTLFAIGVIPFLACDEIASMATEVVYSQNTLCINISCIHQNKMTPVKMPPRTVRQHVRSILFVLGVEPFSVETLQKLAELGFTNLQCVDVEIEGFKWGLISSMGRIKIPTQMLRVHYRHDTKMALTRGSQSHQNYAPDDLGIPVWDMFTIAGEDARIQETYERVCRYYRKDENGKARLWYERVEEWPTVIDNRQPHMRETKKVVWI
jgi:hypothetical protein